MRGNIRRHVEHELLDNYKKYYRFAYSYVKNKANVDIPQISDENVEDQESVLGINKAIEEYAEQLIEMYEKDLKKFNGEGHYTLESSYEVIRDDEHY